MCADIAPREARKRHQKLLAPMRIQALPCRQASQRAHHLDVEQMRRDERIVAARRIASQGGQWTVREEFHYHLGRALSIENMCRTCRAAPVGCPGKRSDAGREFPLAAPTDKKLLIFWS